MQSRTIHDLPAWRVISYVNGLAYSIEHKPSGKSLFFQEDDAAQFRDEFDKLTSGIPSLEFADALQCIWSDYSDCVR